jgi:hypothetical protein
MHRITLTVAALLLLAACGDQDPDRAARMAAFGRSLQTYGAQVSANSQPVYAYPTTAPGTLRYCGTDGMGNPWFCY